ncbi:probable tubulin polyglutamylase ttll-15 isoform X2 [Amphiura filiformis]|uniref:probable tubulin polyglutamylase ttll-15 isoform X2 n=1 Tax=Amphiura filiformis TaxID=82378 RepID=UPI003B21F9D5
MSYIIVRLIICIQIIITISVKFFLYQYDCHQIHLPELSTNSPGYKTGQPLLSWYRKYWNDEIFFTDYIHGLMKYVTYKAHLVSLGGKYIPRGFHIPREIKEFLKYSSLPENQMQDKRWVQKDPWHRGNMIKEIHELNFTQASLIQEFIHNPFLIDGRKFSIAAYVAFSSAKPLRAYVLNSISELRFCPEAYDAHNFTEFRTHITDGNEFGSQYIRDMDSLKDYSWKQRYSTKQALDAYVNLIGDDPSAIHLQINDAIRDVLSKRIDLITRNNIDPRSRYFVMTRWDFVLDSDMKIHLIEVNVNPAMGCIKLSTEELDPPYCDNIVYNLYRVMGITSFYDFHKTSIQYIIRDSDIHVKNAICYTTVCNLCETKECQLCSHCLSDTQRDILKSVLWEHLQRGETRLVYPFVKNEPMKSDDTSRKSSRAKTDDDNALTTEWLRFKCNTDIQWCIE